MANKKNIGKLISFFLVILIFYFLGRKLFLNWQQIKAYQFSFNYFYLIASFALLAAGFLTRGLTWKKIVNFLQPDNDLNYFESVKFDAFSQLGKYLPGKIFIVLGKIYLARNKNISKKNLYFSSALDAVLHAVAAFALSLLLIIFFFGYQTDFLNYYLIGSAIIAGVMVFIHPRVFRPAVRFIFSKIKKEPVDLDFNLSWFQKLKIIFYFSLAEFFFGAGFYFLINSIIYLHPQNLLMIIGFYILSGVLGLVALFAPGGLGIREGSLVLFLQPLFPLSMAILVSFLSRIWMIIGDILLVGVFYFYERIKNKKKY